jgi:hypothetical protein
VRRREEVDRASIFGRDDQTKLSLLSNESIVAVNARSFALFAKPVAQYPVILLVVRNPDMWVRSYYVQQVRSKGEHRRFPRWYRKEREFLTKRMNYDHIFETYTEVLGRENVVFLPYEMLRHEPERFTNELSKLLGVEIPEPETSGAFENISLDPYEAEALRKLHSGFHVAGLGRLSKHWAKSLQRGHGRLIAYDRGSVAARVLRRFQKPILRSDRERSARLDEIWTENRFVTQTSWGTYYGHFYR